MSKIYVNWSWFCFFFQKQDGKDNSIQKRLSWNYGQHIPNNELSLQQQKLPSQGRHAGSKCLSSDSMHSSSGVSSTGSLHLSIGSEWEDSTASTGTVVTATHIYRNLSNSKEENGNYYSFPNLEWYQNCPIMDLVVIGLRCKKFNLDWMWTLKVQFRLVSLYFSYS